MTQKLKHPIRVLDDQTINQIAAGEVIENPASVVKELVENALDAGATDVTVEIEGGGRQLLRVTDNGSGMSHDDALLSLERHATSKIRVVDDLNTLGSMGFRGEALPSIAAISKFNLLTAQEKQGTLIVVDGGKMIACSKAAREEGTTIEVKQLFFNVPARKKFQKSPAHDQTEVLKTMTQLALAHPHIKFHLLSNQKTTLQTHPSNEKEWALLLKERIGEVLGKEYTEAMRPLEAKSGPYHLRGYIGAPTMTRPNRTGQFLFINERPVQMPFISFVIREAYGTTLDSQRYPLFVLHLTLPASEIDVNVHPQKKEVRLKRQYAFRELLLGAVERALQQGGISCGRHIEVVRQEETPTQFMSVTPSSDIKYVYKPSVDPVWSPSIPRVLCMIPGYLILESADGLRLLDQKAAEARIVYERLVKGQKARKVETQSLLIPITFDVTPTEAQVFSRQLEKLEQIGFHVRPFGEGTFLIEGYPTVLEGIDFVDFFRASLSLWEEDETAKILPEEAERRLAVLASRKVIRRAHRLTLAEAEKLLEELLRCQITEESPTGKPIFSLISFQEIEKKFR